MSLQNFLFEIGGEELPPKALDNLTKSLYQQIAEGLTKVNLSFNKDQSRYFASPRRMAVYINGLESQQQDKEVEKRGPAVQAAFDADGNPTPAANGFARSCGVDISQLGRLKTDKGEWLAFSAVEKGKSLQDLLPAIIKNAIDKLPIPKRMRWGNSEYSFVRPVHWITCLYGDEVMPLQVMGKSSGRLSAGHRIHHPAQVNIANADSYVQSLKTAFVLVDHEKRKELIIEQAHEAAQNLNGKAIIDDGVLQEVTNLTEWPIAISGSFDTDFLRVPQECLISSMEEHQKMFPVVDQNDKLMPNFIGFANIESKNPSEVMKGFEKVIRPRLADAAFFWDQDRKHKLVDKMSVLDGMIFQKKLGSISDKTKRVASLVTEMAQIFDIKQEHAEGAAQLYKCDLATDMVYEFTDLQGIMGRYYANDEGYDSEISLAIEEHYLPKFAGDQIPASKLGKALALCDRLDTLTGIFAAGLKPTGNKDPFALRRAALGVIRIIIEGGLDISLHTWLQKSGALLPDSVNFDEKTLQELVHFIHERMRGVYLDLGFTHGQFDAVLNSNPASPVDFDQRIKACKEFAALEAAPALAAANKRIANILKKSPTSITGEPESSLYQDDAEKELGRVLSDLISDVHAQASSRNYLEVLQALSKLREPVDHFFDEVMVMVDDEKLKNNRLKLLQQLRTQFLLVADISLL